MKLAPPVKTKIKSDLIRYVDSLRVGDRGGEEKKNKYALNEHSHSRVV